MVVVAGLRCQVYAEITCCIWHAKRLIVRYMTCIYRHMTDYATCLHAKHAA